MTTTDFENELRAVFSASAAAVPETATAAVLAREYKPRRVHRTRGRDGGERRAARAGDWVALSSGGGGAPAARSHRTGRVDLTAAVRSALATASPDVLHVRTTFSDGAASERWLSADGSVLHIASSGSGGAHANVVYAYADGKLTTTEVDASRRIWSQETIPWSTAPGACDAASAGMNPDAVARNLVQGYAITSDSVRSLVAAGDFVRRPGTQEIDGVSTYELASTGGAAASTLWIDVATNLPVRVALQAPGEATAVLQSDLSWLEPSPANLALLRIAVPDGYTRVPSVDAVENAG